MNAELAQLVSLTAYGNAFLAGDTKPFPLDVLRQSSSGFTFTLSTGFMDNGQMVAQDPTAWFQSLLERRAIRLWAMTYHTSQVHMTHYIEPISSGIARGIQVDARDGKMLWSPQWVEDE